MQKIHAIFGFRYQNQYKLAVADVDGWPDVMGKNIVAIVQNNTDNNLISIWQNLELTQADFSLNAEYKYIVNLDNLTLEYYCQNRTPRAIFKLDDLRKTDINQIVSILESLEEPKSRMYNLFASEKAS